MQNDFPRKVLELVSFNFEQSVAFYFISFVLICMIYWATSLLLFDDPFKMSLHHHSLSYMRFDT